MRTLIDIVDLDGTLVFLEVICDIVKV